MNNIHIKSITAVTEVFPDGQKCIGVELSYDCIFAEEMVTRENFEVREMNLLLPALSGMNVRRDFVRWHGRRSAYRQPRSPAEVKCSGTNWCTLPVAVMESGP